MGQEALLPNVHFSLWTHKLPSARRDGLRVQSQLSGDPQTVCLADEIKPVQGPPHGQRQTVPPHCTHWLPSFLLSHYVSV